MPTIKSEIEQSLFYSATALTALWNSPIFDWDEKASQILGAFLLTCHCPMLVVGELELLWHIAEIRADLEDETV